MLSKPTFHHYYLFTVPAICFATLLTACGGGNANDNTIQSDASDSQNQYLASSTGSDTGILNSSMNDPTKSITDDSTTSSANDSTKPSTDADTPTTSPTSMPASTDTASTTLPVATTTTTTTTTASTTTATRDPLKWPFASTSIWNMPIGTGAQYAPANLAADPGGYAWAPLFNPDPEHIVLTPTAPLTTFNYSSAGWSGASRCTASGGSRYGLPVSVPMPSGYVIPSDNTNSGAAFLAADKRTIIQMQPVARCTAGRAGTALVKFANVDLYGNGIVGAHGGSGLSSIGGSIRLGELRPGQPGMRHALKVNVYSALELYHCSTKSNCYRWPATTADSSWSSYGTRSGPNNNNPAMKMGALLAIPLNVNLGSLSLETEPGKQIAWTLQHYGAYIVDSYSGPGFGFSVEEGAAGSFSTQFLRDWGYSLLVRYNANSPWSRDLAKIRTALRVVNNNSSTSIGGGGTPSQPLAPQFQ